MSVESPAELQFLLRCCRTAVSGQRSSCADMPEVTPAFDWELLFQEAIWHGVIPLLSAALQSAPSSVVPADILDALDVYMQRHTRRAQEGVSALLKVLSALNADGIEAIPFKGPLLGDLLYSNTASREFRDLDFLVPVEDIGAVRNALGRLGYAPALADQELPVRVMKALERYDGQTILWKPGVERPLEPHWTIAPWNMSVELDYPALWRHLSTHELDGSSVNCLAPEDLFIVFCVHGSKEQWHRIKLIADAARFMEVYDCMDWQAVIQRAREQGCLRMVLLGALLAHRLFRTELPRPVAENIPHHPALESLASQVFRSSVLQHTDMRVLDQDRLSLFRLRMRERNRDRVRCILRTILTPRMAHFQMLELPAALFPLYYPVKIIHDYLLLPVWMVMKKSGLVSQSSPQNVH